MLGVAVLGAGRIGTLHAETLGRCPAARLLWVMDPLSDRARAAGHEGRATASLEEVLADPDVEAVVIASSTPEHASQIEAAASAGKAVFCEKPVSLEIERARRALDAVQAAAVPFQVGFQRRYDPGYAAARREFASGQVGQLELFRSLSCDPDPPPLDYLKVSGGVFRDMMVHDIDLARWFGGEIQAVLATGAALVVPELTELGDADTALLTLRFCSGALGVIQNRRRSGYGTDIRTEIFGTLGKLVVEADPPVPVRRYDQTGGHHSCHGWFLDRFRQAYQNELEAFVEAVLVGRSPEPGATDALESLRVALAATESFQQGRWVEM